MRRRTRNHFGLLFGAVFVFVGGSSAGEPTAGEISAQERVPPLTVDQARADAKLLIGVMRDIHPGYTRYRSEEAAVTSEQEFREAATGAGSLSAFYLDVSEFLSKIRCEHTEAELPKALAAVAA